MKVFPAYPSVPPTVHLWLVEWSLKEPFSLNLSFSFTQHAHKAALLSCLCLSLSASFELEPKAYVCVCVCVRANIRHRWRSITAPGASVPWGPGPCFRSQDPKQNRPLSCNQVRRGSDYYPIRAQHERIHTGLSHMQSKGIPKYRK